MFHRRIIAFLILALPLFGCQPAPFAQSRHERLDHVMMEGVHQGTPIQPTGSVWRTSIELQLEGNRICSATLIAKNFAVSAAHCVANFAPELLIFRNGSNEIVSTAPVVEKFVHSGFVKGEEHHDLVLLKFSGGLPTEGFRPVEMVLNPEDIKMNSEVILVGAGLVGVQKHDGLTSASLRIFSATDTKFLATDPGGRKSACVGDSGGSGYIRHGKKLLLAGVITHIFLGATANCSAPARANQFIKLGPYAEWIRDVTKGAAVFVSID